MDANRPDSNISIRTKLFLFVFVGFLSLIAVQTVITISNAIKHNKDDEKHRLLDQYDNYKDRIDSLQNTIAAIARSTAAQPDIARLLAADNRHGLLNFLQPVYASLKTSLDISNLTIHHADGRVFLRLHQPAAYGDAISTHGQMITAAMRRQTVVGIDFDREVMGFRGASPISFNDQVIGMVAVGRDVDQAFMEDLKARSQADYTFWLTYAAANPVGMQPKDKRLPAPSPKLFFYAGTHAKALAVDPSVYHRVMATGKPEVAFVAERGEPLAVLVGPLLGFQNHIIGIVEISRSRAETLDRLHRSQVITLVAAGGLAFLGLVVLWFLINLAVLRPLGHLSAVARRQLEGDLQARVKALPKDEFGQLGHSFNSLSNKVSETFAGQKRSIADLKRTEETLRATESKYRRLYEESRRRQELYHSLLHSIPDAIIIYDIEGRAQYVNPAFSTIFRWSPEEVLGRQIPFVPDDEKEKSFAIITALIEKGTPCNSFETRRYTKTGETVAVNISASRYDDHQGNPTGMLVVMRDIRIRNRTVDELRKSEEKYRNILENIEEGYFEVDLEGIFVFGNEALSRNTGYALDELIGANFRKLTSDQIGDQMYRLFNQVFQSGQPVKNAEITILAKGGDTRVGEISVSPITDQTHQTTGFRGVVRDVTERADAKRERAMLEAQLRQAQKMEAIGTLAGGIAHDFNNILAPIMGYAELALSDVQADSQLRKNLVPILNAAHRAKDLVQQILAFSRQSDQEHKPLKLQPIIKEALKLLRSSLPTTIEIRQQVDADCGSVMADPTQIHQVIMNLCTNAYHAMRDQGGILTVALIEHEATDENGPAYHELAPGPYLKMTIKDTGQGIDQQTMERIFEPYFTTKEKGEGTGMGLSVVHGIVRGHGGHIDVTSRVGQGACFDIYLPRLVVEEEAAKVGEPIEKLQTGSERILLVDDEEAIVLVLQSMLVRLGYTVTTRTGSVEALHAFRAGPQRFDLVITDMTMPNMTGDHLAQAMRQIRPDIPIIVCTGFSEQISSSKAAQLGIKGFIMKPVVIKELARVVREALNS